MLDCTCIIEARSIAGSCVIVYMNQFVISVLFNAASPLEINAFLYTFAAPGSMMLAA
jgi:hypothetical protein